MFLKRDEVLVTQGAYWVDVVFEHIWFVVKCAIFCYLFVFMGGIALYSISKPIAADATVIFANVSAECQKQLYTVAKTELTALK